MPPSRRATPRTYIVSLSFSLAVATLCFVVEWHKSGDPRNYLNGHYYAENQHTIDSLSRALDNWRKTHGSLPQSLKPVCNSEELQEDWWIHFNSEGEVTDRWGNLIVYKVEGNDYELISYGEDGKPGGVWFDSDLSNREPYPPASFPPPLGVFCTSEIGHNAILLSLLTGIFCFACSFLLLREEVPQDGMSDDEQAKSTKRRIPAIASRLVALTVVALFAIGVAMVLGAVHLVHGEYH